MLNSLERLMVWLYEKEGLEMLARLKAGTIDLEHL